MSSAMRWVLAGFLVLTVSGCASYYKVTDPTSDAVYYTQKVDEKTSGAVAFTDEKTNTKITIQSSQIQEISKDEYKSAVEAVEGE